MNKLEIMTRIKDSLNQVSYGTFDFRGNEFILLPKVCPAIYNTGVLSEIVDELVSSFLVSKNLCRVFEMGSGSGAAILTAAKIEGVVASASDIAPMATLNTKVNALWWGIECNVYEGNLFENVPKQEFDIIFWNIPSIGENIQGIKDIHFRSVFDPDYKYLTQFLVDVNNYLAENGQILLGGIEYNLSDLNQIYTLIDEAGFTSEVYREYKMPIEEIEILYSHLLLTRK